MASTAPASCCFSRRHNSAPRPPEIISSTIASCGLLSSHCSSASPTASPVHPRPLGAQEELRQVRGHGIAFGEQHEQPRTTVSTVARRGLTTFALVCQQPMSVGRRQAARHLRRDEAQLLHLVA